MNKRDESGAGKPKSMPMPMTSRAGAMPSGVQGPGSSPTPARPRPNLPHSLSHSAPRSPQPMQVPMPVVRPSSSAPPVYNPFRAPVPLQPIQAKMTSAPAQKLPSAASWKPGTAPPVYRPQNGLLQRKSTPETKSPVRAPVAVHGSPRLAPGAIQRSAEATYEVVKGKKAKKLEKKQAVKAGAKARTYCSAWLDSDFDAIVFANSGLTKEAWSALATYAPALAEKIGGTREKKETPAIACAEPQAVALFLATYGKQEMVTLAGVRVGTSYDEVTDRYKSPCPNCSTWLEVAVGEEDESGNIAYRIKAAYR